jgi:hypothetical protein
MQVVSATAANLLQRLKAAAATGSGGEATSAGQGAARGAAGANRGGGRGRGCGRGGSRQAAADMQDSDDTVCTGCWCQSVGPQVLA